MESSVSHTAAMRDDLQLRLSSTLDTMVHGPDDGSGRLPGTLSIGIKGCHSGKVNMPC